MNIFGRLCAVSSLIAFTGLFSSCATGPGAHMPKGNIGNYQSARLITRNPYAENFGSPEAIAFKNKVHGMIQKSIKSDFTSHGISYGKSQSDLTVAYLILLQNKAITYHYNEYFGQGPNANEIARKAHEEGVINKKDVSAYHNRAGIIVDIIDTQTNKVIYSHFYATDVVHVPTDAERARRIDYAIKSTLAPFFVKK